MPIGAITAAAPVGGTDAIGATGSEWTIDAPQGIEGVGSIDGAAKGGGFGSMLADQIGALQGTQDAAATASQQLAAGTATDASSVVMAVERAQLSMQLASQLRNKAVEAYQDVFRTQV